MNEPDACVRVFVNEERKTPCAHSTEEGYDAFPDSSTPRWAKESDLHAWAVVGESHSINNLVSEMALVTIHHVRPRFDQPDHGSVK